MEYRGIIGTSNCTIYQGDCRDILKEKIESNTIDCIITSPPYFGCRAYSQEGRKDGNEAEWIYSTANIGAKAEIGVACEYDEYISDLQIVIKECYRTLKENKFMFINIGNKHDDKQLIDYSHDIIQVAKKIGFMHCDTIIWIKRNSQPPGRHEEIYLGNAWEYVLMFVKGKKYVINYKGYMKGYSHFKCKKCGEENYVELSAKPNYFYSNIGFYGKADKFKKPHQAPFAKEVPRFCLGISTEPGDIVLDPFAGSGTTLIEGLYKKLNVIGCELIQDIYINLIYNMEQIGVKKLNER